MDPCPCTHVTTSPPFTCTLLLLMDSSACIRHRYWLPERPCAYACGVCRRPIQAFASPTPKSGRHTAPHVVLRALTEADTHASSTPFPLSRPPPRLAAMLTRGHRQPSSSDHGRSWLRSTSRGPPSSYFSAFPFPFQRLRIKRPTCRCVLRSAAAIPVPDCAFSRPLTALIHSKWHLFSPSTPPSSPCPNRSPHVRMRDN